VALCAAVAGCSFTGGIGPTAYLENGTDVPIAVYVNGGWVGTYPPGTRTDVPIGGHGGPPYAIEVRTPSGVVLTQLGVSPADIANGGSVGAGASMPCGEVQLTYGAVERRGGPARVAPIEPGSCP